MVKLMTQSILILAAHPDDEVLGCGGTIAKLTDEGAIVHVAFLADGVFSRVGDQKVQQQELNVRRNAAKKACEILSVKSVSFGSFKSLASSMILLISDESRFLISKKLCIIFLFSVN